MMIRDAPAHEEHQRHHRHQAEQADADMRRAPAGFGDEILQHRRPQRAGDIVADRGERHRNAAPVHKPVRYVGHQRAEARRAADADQQVRKRNLPKAE